MLIASHGGDIGDVIYACPSMRAMAEKAGAKIDLVLHPESPHPCKARGMKPCIVMAIAPLLEEQPYIGRVRYSPKAEGVPLDGWRRWYMEGMNLAVAHLAELRIPTVWAASSWFKVPGKRTVAPVVFARSARYRNDTFPWKAVWDVYGQEAVFVGVPSEHEDFCSTVGEVPFCPTPNFLELARVIGGAKLFVGNQSSPYAIAEALKMDTIQETWLGDANCVFPRANAIYGIDEHLKLPDIQ